MRLGLFWIPILLACLALIQKSMWNSLDTFICLSFAVFFSFIVYSDMKRLKRLTREIEERQRQDIERERLLWQEMERRRGNG